MSQHPLDNPPDDRQRHPLEMPDPRIAQAEAMRAAREEGKIVALELPNSGKTPYFTYALLVINVVVFGIGFIAPQTGNMLLNEGALYPYRVIEFGEWWRLFTLMFLHANLIHLVMNCSALYSLGTGIEITYGWRRFLLIYFLGGLLGSVIQLLLGGDNPAVGASGAVFALVGAEIVHTRLHRDFYLMGRNRLQQLLMLAGINLAIGLVSPLIANWAHLGGLVGGMLLAWFLSPRFTIDRSRMIPNAKTLYAIDTNPLTLRRWLEVGGFVIGLVVLCGLALALLNPQRL